MASFRWLDDCCRPIKMALHCMMRERFRFVSAAVVELETSAPEVVAQTLEQCKHAVSVSADGTQAISLRSGKIYWDAAARPAGLTRVHDVAGSSFDSAAAYAVSAVDPFYYIPHAYCRELPEAILDYIAADPMAPLARQFRLYARHSLVHGLRQVSTMLEAHAAVVELPSLEW
eukprot:SAG31_NODE_65_length_28565_cov_8.402914_14_plen_173_part_00